MKIRPVGAEFFFMRTVRNTDRQTDMKKLRVPFRNFANAPEKPHFSHYALGPVLHSISCPDTHCFLFLSFTDHCRQIAVIPSSHSR